MEIKEGKSREVGNSIVITLSGELLRSIGVIATDTVYVDEEKLEDITVKKNMSEHQKKLQQTVEDLKQKRNELYKELVIK